MKFSLAIVLIIASVSAVSIRDDPKGAAPAKAEPVSEENKPGYPNISSDGGYAIKKGSI